MVELIKLLNYSCCFTEIIDTLGGMPTPGERVTLREIALAAGVSVSTVSRALREDTDIAADTSERIRRLAREHGYRRPHRRERSATLVDLVLSDLSLPWSMAVIRGAERASHQLGISVVVSRGRHRLDRGVASRLRYAGASAGVIVDAALLTAASTRTARDARRPMVVLDPQGDAETDLPIVAATAWTGGFDAANLLLGQRHRRIGIVAGPRHVKASLAPVSGYRIALQNAGVRLDDDLVGWGDLSPESGLRETARLLDLPDPPTAILVRGDRAATGAFEAVRDCGLVIPHDVSLIGLVDVTTTGSCCLPLARVRPPFAEMGALADRKSVV